MENYYVDGVEMHFFDGSVVPLDPSSEVVLHWVSKDYLAGYIGANGRVRYGRESKVITPGNPAIVAGSVNMECSYHGQPLPKTIEAKPRGGQEYKLYEAGMLRGFQLHKVPTMARGILATLSSGRQALVDKNQTVIFFNCKPEVVSSRLTEFSKVRQSWANPVVAKVPYDLSLEVADRLNGMLLSGGASSVQIKFEGNGSQLIYPASYFRSFSLI